MLRSFRQKTQTQSLELLEDIKHRMGLFFEEAEIAGILEELEQEIKNKLRPIKATLIAKAEEERREFHDSGLIQEVSGLLGTGFLLR